MSNIDLKSGRKTNIEMKFLSLLVSLRFSSNFNLKIDFNEFSITSSDTINVFIRKLLTILINFYINLVDYNKHN